MRIRRMRVRRAILIPLAAISIGGSVGAVAASASAATTHTYFHSMSAGAHPDTYFHS